MYTYTAGPPDSMRDGRRGCRRAVQGMGEAAQEPALRARVRKEMSTPTDEWENLRLAAGGEGTLWRASRRSAAGERRQDARRRRESEHVGRGHRDGSRRRRRQRGRSSTYSCPRQRPPADPFAVGELGSVRPRWLEGVFVKTSTHPRAYGNFERRCGSTSATSASPARRGIRKLTSLRRTLRIKERGHLATGYLADVVVFDAQTIASRTYEQQISIDRCPARGSMACRC